MHDDLPKDLAKPRKRWETSEVMGIVIGGLLLLCVVGLVLWGVR